MFTKQELFTLRALVRQAVATGDPETPEVGMIMAKITGMIARTPDDNRVGAWTFRFNEEQDRSGAKVAPSLLTRTPPKLED